MKDLKLGTVLDASLAGKVISGLWTTSEKLSVPGFKILNTSRFTCSACGFKTKPTSSAPHGWMVPIDSAHPALLALDDRTGVCLCPLCASAMAINWSVVSKAVKGKSASIPGMLIYMPTMTQREINLIALHLISIHASRKVSSQTSLETAAINVNNIFIAQNAELAGKLPIYRHGEDDAFARALAMLPREHYHLRDEIIGSLRWWPAMDYWRRQGNHWMETTYGSLSSPKDLEELI